MKKKIFKNIKWANGLFIASVVMAGSFTITSCSTSKPVDTRKVAEEHNEAKFNNKMEKDADWLVAAAEMDLSQIQLGQLAQKNGMAESVKQMGKMMEMDHSNALSQLRSLAVSKQISLPVTVTDAGKEAYNDLMSKPGKDFDKAYTNMMANDHKDAIEKFEKVSSHASDADIKAWAVSYLPSLRMDLDQALTCQKMF
jgi:putative membrane protein